jgi:hypothetical protein
MDNNIQAPTYLLSEDASEQSPKIWVTPKFEQIPLNEAMSSGPNLTVTDGGSLYTS